MEQKTLAYYSSILRMDFTDYCRNKLKESGISMGLLYFVLYIGRHPECSMSEVSDALKANAGHTTRCIDKLVQGGFAERRRTDNDRRTAALKLTEQGEAVFAKAHTLFWEWDQIAMKDLDEESRALLLNMLEQIVKRKGR